jgi:type I restriction enzyme, S subunit
VTRMRLADCVRQVTSIDIPEGPFVSLDDLDGGTGRLRPEVELAVREAPQTGAVSFTSGDVLFGKLRPYLRKSWLASHDGLASTELIVMRPISGLIEPRWLAYLAMSKPFLQWAVASSDGVKMPRTSWDKLRNLQFRLPRIHRQRQIADSLDLETQRIAALIDVKRRQGGLLVQRQVSLVSESVGCGEPVPIRYLTSLRTSGPRGWGELVGTTGDPFIRSGNLRRDAIALRTDNLSYVEAPVGDESERSRVKAGDVVVGITGANTGWVGIVPGDLAGGYVSQHVAILRPASVLSEWLAYSVFGHRSQSLLIASQYGGTKQQLGLDDLAEVEIMVPTVEEQRRLTESLSRHAGRTARVFDRLARQIGLLVERREALVTDGLEAFDAQDQTAA